MTNDRRRLDRRPCRIGLLGTVPALVENVSNFGARVRTSTPLQVGAQLHLAGVRTRVVWRQDGAAGLRFECSPEELVDSWAGPFLGRQRAPRFQARLPVRLSTPEGGLLGEASTVDISARGMQVRANCLARGPLKLSMGGPISAICRALGARMTTLPRELDARVVASRALGQELRLHLELC